MAINSPSVPATLRAGDSIEWVSGASDYPANAGWTLSWRLINPSGKIDITSSASGADHAVAVAAATSAAWPAGRYEWVCFANNAGQRKTIATGLTEVLPDLAAQTAGFDTRTTARKLLDAIESALINRASRTDLEYEIAGRRIKSMSHGELLSARDKLKREVASEEKSARVAAGLSAGNRVLVRFG